MKDRVSKYPGRVRLTPVAGSDDLFDLVRADEPEEAGTPINKNSLLKDETAEMLGLDQAKNPTPDDALKKIMEIHEPNVGDVRETVRDDLGENWLLCNGDPVPEGEYPEVREMLHYNTEWKRLPAMVGYSTIRPLPVAGQWLMLKRAGTNVPRHYDTQAFLYDANTGEVKTITCPVPSGATEYGIAGLTHDGDRYILLVSNKTASKVVFYTTADFVTWTQIYTTSLLKPEYYAYDVTYDGANILWMEGYLSASAGVVYGIRCINRGLSKVTNLFANSTSTSPYYLYPLPGGYWAIYADISNNVTVLAPGSKTTLFSFAADFKLGRVAFFNDRYWLGIPNKGEEQRTIQCANLTSNAVSNIFVENVIMGVTDIPVTAYLYDMEYIRETNEWVMYVNYKESSNAGYQFYCVYISADADPTVAENYRRVQVESLPEIMPSTKMAPDRSRMHVVSDKEIYLRDPNQKYLPSHDGDTYKYIYAGDGSVKYVTLGYLEATGTQYIDTGFKPNGNTRTVMTAYSVQKSSWIYGAWHAKNDTMYAANAEGVYSICYGSEIVPLGVVTIGAIVIDQNKGEYTYNGVSGTVASSDFSCAYSMYLFAINAAGVVSSNRFYGRIHSCQIYDNGTLVRDFVPCRREFDGKLGMLDLVSNKFFTNRGTGEFVAGEEVGSIEIKEGNA